MTCSSVQFHKATLEAARRVFIQDLDYAETPDGLVVNFFSAGVWLCKVDGVDLNTAERVALVVDHRTGWIEPAATQYSAAEWLAYYAKRAKTCRVDAAQSARYGRPDIAAMLRRSARDYLNMARFAAWKVTQ